MKIPNSVGGCFFSSRSGARCGVSGCVRNVVVLRNVRC